MQKERPQLLRARRIEIAFLVLAVICGGLAYGSPVRAAEHAGALIVYPGATHVGWKKYGGTDQLTYRVDAKFPAAGVIGFISYKLHENGWQVLAHDFLNPKIPSSAVRGWTEFIDGTRRPKRYMHEWGSDWRDSAGNMVRYIFHYTSPKNFASNLRDLHVTAIYSPAPLARKQERLAKKIREKRKAALPH